MGGRKVSSCAHRHLKCWKHYSYIFFFFFFLLPVTVSRSKSWADKKKLRSHLKALRNYFIVSLHDIEYHCTYVSVISFLASNFQLCFLLENSEWDMSTSFLSISTLPWGYGELHPDKLLQSGMGMHSLLLLMERWILYVIKTCSRKNHKLQHVL